MKRSKRTNLIMRAVYNRRGSTPDSTSNDENKDPFADSDNSDPTYVPEKQTHRPESRVSGSSASNLTCEYVSCTEDVFSACSKCNTFLCWDHFDNTQSYSDCEFHKNSIHCNNEANKTLTGDGDQNDFNETLTESKNDCTSLIDVTNCINQQHCEYKNCNADIFTTCIQCQGFLCNVHFDKFCLDNDCSQHKSFSTDSQDTIIFSNSMRKIIKRKRNLGLEYLNWKKNKVDSRSLKKPCDESTCRLKCTTKIDETKRKQIFDNYWSLGDINRQRDFIKNSMQEIKSKHRSNRCQNCMCEKPLRALNNAFYFNIGDQKIRICKKFFKSTLDINDKVILTVRKKTNVEGFVTEDLRGKHSKHAKLTEESAEVCKFINSIPRIESHYIRAQSSRQYIEGSKSLTQIYEDYKKECVSNSKRFVSKSTFSNIFHKDFNISFFQPKKDRCEVCVSFENSNDEEKNLLKKNFYEHQKEKLLSRSEKQRDKEKVSESYIVACYDLQAVLTAPRGEVSVFYYISKLATYNLTVSELGTGLTTCFVWHEGQGHRGVTEIGTCVLKFIENKIQNMNAEDKEFVFFSDNCCGQQKNKIMIALYLYAVNKYKLKSITHKFLIKGHTQMEGDAVHSTIEKAIKRSLKSGPIYSPQEYVSIIKTAKKNPPYLAVKELAFGDFYDIKSMSDKIANNFSKTTDNCYIKLTDIKIIKVLKHDPLAFYVKTSYADEEFKRIEIRKSNTRHQKTEFAFPDSLDRAYSEKIPVTEKKKLDILKLIDKRHIPQTYYNFYNSL